MLDIWTEESEVLLAGTIMIETGWNYLKQVKGEAYGFYQIQKQSHSDVKIWMKNGFNKELTRKSLIACDLNEIPMDNDILIYNLNWATIIARLIYHRAKPPIPSAHDAKSLAIYHKEFYNGGINGHGKTDIETSTAIFQKVISKN